MRSVHRVPAHVAHRSVPPRPNPSPLPFLTFRFFTYATAYVMEAFLETLGPIAKGKVTMLADGNHELAQALGLDFDASSRGMGRRVQRFALVLDGDAVVRDVQVDTPPGPIKTTRAGFLLSRL